MKKVITKIAGTGAAIVTTMIAGVTKVAAATTTSDSVSAGTSVFMMVCWCGLAIIGLASLAFSVWMLIDALKRDEKVLPKKIIWALVIWFTSPIGGIAYYFMRKRVLDK